MIYRKNHNLTPTSVPSPDTLGRLPRNKWILIARRKANIHLSHLNPADSFVPNLRRLRQEKNYKTCLFSPSSPYRAILILTTTLLYPSDRPAVCPFHRQTLQGPVPIFTIQAPNNLNSTIFSLDSCFHQPRTNTSSTTRMPQQATQFRRSAYYWRRRRL